MGYGDYTPASSSRTKPLTKKQLIKARKAYERVNTITDHVKALEEKEWKNALNELEKLDNFL
jgi:hypothetical protein